MIDFVLWVENTKEWHKENLRKNSKDYSRIVRFFWSNFANFLQKLWAKIYYNPFIEFESSQIKYWVIQIDDLIEDLEEWKNLYVAWRLHKPVEILSSSEEVEKAIKKNLEHAFNVAILLLTENFSEEELYTMIASISYMWDSRMKHWENPNKVKNIVSKNIEWFRKLYSDILSNSSLEGDENWIFTQDISQEKCLEIVKLLPKNLLAWLTQDSLYISREKLQEDIKKRIWEIVKSSSIEQTLKWIFTAWIWKSIKYASEKIKKAKKWKWKN
jgi:mitochondrial translocator assembly and maintenance protein 41